MRVVILGPNLEMKNQAKGSLHAHAEGCGDIKKSYGRHEQESGDTIEVDTIKEIVIAMYDPGDFGYDADVPGEYEGYRNDIFIAPCVTLPEGKPYG